MKGFLNWSGGKDSAFCLHEARAQGMTVEALVTSVSRHTGRIAMHGVPRALLEQQAASVQLPLHLIELPDNPGMTAYEEAIGTSNRILSRQGFDSALSGDLFLEDLKTYRSQLYARDGLQAVFPLWQKDTRALMEEFLRLGFRAIVVCTGEALDKSFCGRLIDESFLNDLPPSVDVCGERGEYHSFVFDGPLFSSPVPFRVDGLVHRTYPAPVSDDCFTEPQPPAGFYFCDLRPA